MEEETLTETQETAVQAQPVKTCAELKKERRNIRHALQNRAYRQLRRRIGLCQTPGQIADGARKLLDRYIAEQTQ